MGVKKFVDVQHGHGAVGDDDDGGDDDDLDSDGGSIGDAGWHKCC